MWVKYLIAELSLRDKNFISGLNKADIGNLHFTLGLRIRNRFKLWSSNAELLESCRPASALKTDPIDADQASAVIIEALWHELQKTHRLRVLHREPSGRVMIYKNMIRRVLMFFY